MAKNIPTLSTRGWVNNLEQKGDFALSYFVTTEFSQSVLFYGRLSSLPYYIKRYRHNPVELESQLQDGLSTYFNRYFDAADVTVSVIPNEDDTSRLKIQFRCIVREGTQTFSLGREVYLLNDKLIKIAELNNG